MKYDKHKSVIVQMEMLIGRSHTAVYLSGYTLKGQQMWSQPNSIEFFITPAKHKNKAALIPILENRGLTLTFFPPIATKCTL